MGLFDGNITGFDINHDGRKDSLDDFIFFESMKSMEEIEDIDDLEDMDEDERIEALEDAGIDPDDYDFD